MKSRIAQKVFANVGPDCPVRYKESTIARANRIVTRNDNDDWWCDLLAWLGPQGRAEIIAKSMPDRALKLLMDTPEDEWEGDPSRWPFVDTSPTEAGDG